MRLLDNEEIEKRGCKQCANVCKRRIQKTYALGQKHIVVSKFCPFSRCKYNELDKFNTYDEYLKVNYKKERRRVFKNEKSVI